VVADEGRVAGRHRSDRLAPPRPERLIVIHQKIGPDYEEKIIRPAVRSVIRLVISEYAVMDVYSSRRAEIQDEINVKIKALVEKDGFMIDEIVLRDVRFTDQFGKAIEAKQIAQQSAEQMKYVLEKSSARPSGR
jgi:regulator of protease activity HflC (stomatin/prohibitin superfamily)